MFVLSHFISFIFLWSQLWLLGLAEILASHPRTRNALFRHMRRNGGVNDCVPKAVPAVQLPPSERFRESRHLNTNSSSRWWFQSCFKCFLNVFSHLEKISILTIVFSIWLTPTNPCSADVCKLGNYCVSTQVMPHCGNKNV